MRLPDLVIPIGAQVSAGVELVSVDKARVYGGGVAFTGVVSIELSPDDEATWYDSTVDVTGTGTAVIDPTLATHIRLSSTLAEAAARTCPLHASGQQHV